DDQAAPGESAHLGRGEAQRRRAQQPDGERDPAQRDQRDGADERGGHRGEGTIDLAVNRPLQIAAYTVLAMLVVGGFEPYYVRVFAADGERTRAAMTELPYRKLPGLKRLLADVDRSTPPGAKIAIALPFRDWDAGYGYGYYRASFLLPGKQVVPLLPPQNMRFADYVVIWKGTFAIDGFVPLWTTADGTLMARKR